MIAAIVAIVDMLRIPFISLSDRRVDVIDVYDCSLFVKWPGHERVAHVQYSLIDKGELVVHAGTADAVTFSV